MVGPIPIADPAEDLPQSENGYLALGEALPGRVWVGYLDHPVYPAGAR
jgi:hypothetical protein